MLATHPHHSRSLPKPPMAPAPPASARSSSSCSVLLLLLLLAAAALFAPAGGVEILSRSRLERCARDLGAGGSLACDRKIVLDLAVPSGSSGSEASLVAQVEENDTQAMHTVRDPPVITINKSATYALYDISYIRSGGEASLVAQVVEVEENDTQAMHTQEKASDFSELDRAECQFATTATVLDNGTQIGPPNQRPKGFFEAIKALWRNTWDSAIDFFTDRSCSTKCSSFFDLSCHIQYICIDWFVMFGLLLALLPAVAVLLWLLHQKGLFDPLYDWWEDVFGPPETAHRRGHQGHHAAEGVPGQHHHRHGGQPDVAAE